MSEPEPESRKGLIHTETHPTGFDEIEVEYEDELTVLRLGDGGRSVTTHLYLTPEGREELESELAV